MSLTISLTKYFSLRRLEQSLLSGGIEKATELFSLVKAAGQMARQASESCLLF